MNAETPPAQRRSVVAIGIAVVAVILAAAAVLFAVTREDRHGSADRSGSPSPTASAGASIPGSPVPSATTPTSAPATDFGYQPLWPFGSVGQAIAWQREANPGGHQPWHLDAGEIAQMFTRQYLGYSGVDKVVKVSTQGEQAWVSVGFDNTNGVAAVAAVLHLARIGEGAANEKPWEVVGSQDATLSLTTPAYGATVRTPVTVGGKITGVDESLRVRILGLGHDRPLGEVTGIPAGGTDTPWTATLPFAADCPATLTLAVSTGGHIAEVERFAVTGVRC